MRLIVEHNLDVISRKHDVHYSNFTHCSRVLHSLNNLLHKISVQNLAAQQTDKVMSATVTNNPIMASPSIPLSPLAAAFRTIVKSSPPDIIDTHSTHNNTIVSTYTDSTLSHYDVNVVLSDSSAGQQSKNEASHSSDSYPTAALPVGPSGNQNLAASSVAGAGESHGVKASFVTEEELRQREFREEQFIRDHLGDVFVEIEPYNHSHCSDCTCVYSMANECLMHLAASQHQSQECVSRIRRLESEFKERVREDAERLDALDWGGHNHVNLA